ncbi:MAG: cyclic beta 1-2 glucan synthetase, partial [Nitrospirota bacterium]|nr:cyclic beta 1-2 glucan synthetase [Nitrospirota bacterium]
MRALFPGNSRTQKRADNEPPLRAELFSAYQMDRHGKVLAGSHKLGRDYAPGQLLTRLDENESVLLDVRNLITEAVRDDRRITPAGEWLLDNFYLIEEQIRTARRHLPKGYSRELPKLLNGPSAGLPRVYDIALETISHGDGRVDTEGLSSFISAYQSVTALKLGELWAIPIMLRLALIENLRRVAARTAADRTDRNLADYWADRMTETAEKDPKSLILVIADMARSGPPMVSSFVAELARRLKGQGPALALPLTWIEQRLSECGQTVEQLVQSENQQQAADQVSMSNSIGSLRVLGEMDWRKFVETMSIVDRILSEDPGGVYLRMDFSTRDRYRHVIEKIAKNSRLFESDVAAGAIRLARENAVCKNNGKCVDDRSAHVGYYLIDKGLAQLEKLAEVRFSVFEDLQRIVSRFPLFLYLGAIMLMTALLAGGLSAEMYAEGLSDRLLAMTGILFLLCSGQLAVALVNWLSTLIVTPHPLPRMDLSKGIPPELRTLAVVPTLLTGEQNTEDLIEALEVRFLANRDENLHFGLLTDFQDACEETLPEDGALLQLAQKRIMELNEKYRNAKGDTFFLFHRPRRWNSLEKVWMGYERKRGKIAELNSFLHAGAQGASKECFSLIVGETAVLSDVKYLITLDTDTQLPRDAARQFVGAMAHPLNRAQYDEDKGRVVAGYSILQPRVAVSLPGTSRSRYAGMCGSDPGIDPYTNVVSDIYQDLFHEGSFIGKGIYDIAAFEQALKGRLPENLMLSHDLIEGCYSRAGLLSDVQLYEEYPSRYSEDVSRRHRWIRGDWQIIRWLLPAVPGLDARFQKNPLSLLSRWKIFDNLRRSLTPSALTLLLLLGWTGILSASAWFWTLSAIGIILVPSLITSITDLLQKPGDVLLGQHLAAALRSARRNFAQAAFTLACLPYEAFFMLDAIVRSTARMLVTRKRLLEWSPHSGQNRNNSTAGDLAAACRTMWAAPLIAFAAGTWLTLSDPAALAAAVPVLCLWFFSPVTAWWISRPLTRSRARLTDGQTLFLRKLSRKTWAFFETFVGPEDNWLPPDNYQEYRIAAVAHRTSPTNMGLALLASLSAYDFGYISAGQLIGRTENALRTMEGLQRHRGHFYNWYDTQTLKPLLPMYISTVDSGNLAAHLLTLRPGLLALADEKILGENLFNGLNDTLKILMDVTGKPVPARLSQLQKDMESVYDLPPATLTAVRLCLDHLAASSWEMSGSLDAAPDSETIWWARAFAGQCRAALDELTFLAPSTVNGIDEIPTLRELAGLGNQRAAERTAAIERLALQCSELARMDYDFLFDKDRNLLSIGYNVSERRLDAG